MMAEVKGQGTEWRRRAENDELELGDDLRP
jgi:hypothetical protein